MTGLKRKHRLIVRTFIFSVVFVTAYLVLNSCNDTAVCSEKIQRIMNVHFYSLKNGVEKDTTIKNFYATGTVRPDSMFYDSAAVSKIQLTLSPSQDMSEFIFSNIYFTDSIFKTYDTIYVDTLVIAPDTLNGMDTLIINTDTTIKLPLIVPRMDTITLKHTPTDKVTFYYNRRIFMLSPECGFTSDFDITGVTWTREAIDSVEVINPNLSTTDEENVKVYF